MATIDDPYATIAYGYEYMRLNADGTIGRDIDGAANYGQPHFNWRVTGACEHTNFGHFYKIYTLEDVLYKSIEWRYKNGAQKVHICDYDHGTERIWGSPKHSVTPMRRPDLMTPPRPWHKLVVTFGNQPVTLSGPYPKWDSPYGTAVSSTARNIWYLSWQTYTLVKPAPDPAYEREWGPGSVTIPYPEWTEHAVYLTNYGDQPSRYIISQSHPTIEAHSLDAIIRRALRVDYTLCT